MKLVCSQAELNGSLQLVSRAIAGRPTHPVLANVLVTADAAAGRISLQGSQARIETRHFEIDARKTNLRSERLEVLATRFHGWVDEACLQAKQYELKANQLVQQVRDLRQDVSEVLQVRAKRMHTKVDESAQLESKRSIFRSVYETTIEAKRVLLG